MVLHNSMIYCTPQYLPVTLLELLLPSFTQAFQHVSRRSSLPLLVNPWGSLPGHGMDQLKGIKPNRRITGFKYSGIQ